MLQSDTSVSAPSVLELNEPSAAILSSREAQSTNVASIGLVVLCTVIGAAAQILMRNGAALMVDTGWAGVLSNRGMHFTPGYPISCGRLIRLPRTCWTISE